MPDVRCGVCAKAFYAKPNWIKRGWGKYCSINCRSQSQFNGKEVKCNVCKKKVYRSLTSLKHSKSKKYFCGKRCQTIWRNSFYRREKHSNWRGGVKTYREILIESGIKRKCIICNIKIMDILTAHHKDHDRKNNDISNLVWLCLNCHHITHKSRKLNERVEKHRHC